MRRARTLGPLVAAIGVLAYVAAWWHLNAIPVLVVYAAGAVLLAAGGLAARDRDGTRAGLLVFGGTVVVCAWLAAFGYGPSEPSATALAFLLVMVALAAASGASAPWSVAARVTLALVIVALLYLHVAHPSLALIGVYAFGAGGVAAAIVGALPAAKRRWPLPVAAIAVLSWIVSAFTFLVTFGVPLAGS